MIWRVIRKHLFDNCTLGELYRCGHGTEPVFVCYTLEDVVGNMRWATAKIQANNKTGTIYVYDDNGNKYPLTEVCETYNLKYNTARSKRYRNLKLNELIHECKKSEGMVGVYRNRWI